MDPRQRNRATSYDPDEHEKGEWRREQISDDEWNDYEWAKTETFGQPTRYLRGVAKRTN